MKQTRNYPAVTVSTKAERTILEGHPWIYDTELLTPEWEKDGNVAGLSKTGVLPGLENGGLVDVVSRKGRYLGTGLLSRRSKIRIRLISRNANDRFDTAFWERRIRYAWEYRKTVMGRDLDACRIIFGEADQFPGLTVDRFGPVLVAQTLSVGMEQLKPVLFPLLKKVLEEDGQDIRGIYERNDVAIRELEGLNQGKGWYPLAGCNPTQQTQLVIRENGIQYLVDVENGQKTGFFLDQKYNRLAVSRLAKGKRVLDCFTHTGSFALNAALGGAEKVLAVDVSEAAVEMARANARLNHLDGQVECMAANVFDLLPQLESEGRGQKPFDFIILDPPAFTKSRKTVAGASRGYKEINLRAMKLLPRGGYLATCSCSHFMEEGMFVKMLHSAAEDAGVQLRQIEARQQSPDHPILWNVPETAYLKFYIFQVI